MFLATLLFIGLLAIFLLKRNQEVVEQFVPIWIEDEVRERRKYQ